MTDIKRIVAAVDFSVFSRPVLEYAMELAKRVAAEIVVVNVINERSVEYLKRAYNEEHPGGFSREKFINDEVGKRTLGLNDLIKECGVGTTPAKVIIRVGNPFEEILAVVTGQSADLLIIAPKGKSNLPDYLFGTTSDKLFKHSPVTVMSIGGSKR